MEDVKTKAIIERRYISIARHLMVSAVEANSRHRLPLPLSFFILSEQTAKKTMLNCISAQRSFLLAPPSGLMTGCQAVISGCSCSVQSESLTEDFLTGPAASVRVWRSGKSSRFLTTPPFNLMDIELTFDL